jgi:DNA (cytosine-5)-methyltransferase 1
MSNEKERPDQKGYSDELSGHQNVLFPIPLTRWERYVIAKQYLGIRSGREVFFETGDDRQALSELSRNKSQGYRVYDTDGIATNQASQAGGVGAKTGLYAVPVLTPDRLVKRQNGRRFKTNGDPSFTITKTDIHGILINETDKNK